jgi:hypothetical protein
MTALQTINIIRSLLDDGLDWFPTLQQTIDAINEAQRRVVHEAVRRRDQRILRPLIYEDRVVTEENNAVTAEMRTVDSSGNIRYAMFPVSCRITEYTTNAKLSRPGAKTFVARWMPYNTFMNYYGQAPVRRPSYTTGLQYPRDAIYTFNTFYTGEPIFGPRVSTTVKFNYNDIDFDYADVKFIAYPIDFVYDDANWSNNVGLELPKEVHPKIISMAAELLNTTDVNELQRGRAVSTQQNRVTLDKSEVSHDNS